MKNFKTLSLLLFLFLSSSLYASNLEIIPYQGSIANASGTPYSGTFDFIFEIQNNDGTSIWNSGTLTLDVNLGAYSVLLGKTPSGPIYDSIWKSYDSLYLEISFNDGMNGMENLSPLVEFLPVPRSITSKYAEAFCGDSIDLESIISLFSFSQQTTTDTINTQFIHINNLTTPSNEYLNLENTLMSLNCPNGTFTTSKGPNGGSLSAVDIPSAEEVKFELDATNLLAKLTGAPLVLPGPTTDDEARLETDKMEFKNTTKLFEQAIDAIGGFTKATDITTGHTVKTLHDAVNKLFKVIGGPIVVLPLPLSADKATLEEDKLLIENDILELEKALDASKGSTKVTETATGKDVEQFLDAINDVVGTISESMEHSNGGSVNQTQVIDDANQVIHISYNNGSNNIAKTYDPYAGIEASHGVLEEIQEDGTGMVFSKLIDSVARTLQLMGIDGASNVGFQFDPSGNTTHHQGNLTVQGILAKLAGSFKIDHPEDPYNKYLIHSFVESPDMMNIYNGNITTNKDGYATIEMPDYFESLNMDFRYQLTVFGDFAQVIIAQEIDDNNFIIRTNKPNIKVSWQVTGVRQDTFANENRIQAVVEKEDKMKGKLLYEPKQINLIK